jgi:hypothetical protein
MDSLGAIWTQVAADSNVKWGFYINKIKEM